MIKINEVVDLRVDDIGVNICGVNAHYYRNGEKTEQTVSMQFSDLSEDAIIELCESFKKRLIEIRTNQVNGKIY